MQVKELEKYERQDAEVYIYFDDNRHSIEMVDLSISDCVDINVKNGIDTILGTII